MMIRSLLFLLFLYVVLVWIICALLYLGEPPKLVEHGLLWTAIGVASLFLWIILERVFGWWRLHRSRKLVRPAAAAGPKPLHEDDAALVNLLKEAEQRLAAAPVQPGAKPVSLWDLPLYLIVGAEGVGKTAVMHHCGVEPTLLAGQVADGESPVTSTRVANLWLARQALFLEVSGHVFAGDPARLTEFLGHLRPGSRTSRWTSWFQPERQIPLRGVLLFLDLQDFMGTPELSKLDRAAQQVRERLQSVVIAVGTEFPVYVLFTKTDALPYFAEFFARLGDGEAGQVFGVLVTEDQQSQGQDRVWAEAETKRLSRRFQSLFLRLSDRRLLALTQESEATRKPAIYEFPREFKRVRTPLVQFLVDVFKPDRLKLGPRLRGFFFTGSRKTERSATPGADVKSVYQSPAAAPGATQFFSSEALAALANPSFTQKLKLGSGKLMEQWVFAADLFGNVLGADRPAIRRVVAASPLTFERYRRVAVGTAAGLTLILGLIWTVSWFGNRQLTADTKSIVEEVVRGSGELNLANLQTLDRLRVRLADLEKDDSLSLHWGLYTGDALEELARRTYFEQLKRLSLGAINQRLAVHLQNADPAHEAEGLGPTYERLKTHRTITVRACTVDQPLISNVLKTTALELFPRLGEEPQILLRTQLDYYTSRLAKTETLPVQLPEDSAAEEKARGYLRRATGVDQQLRALLADLGQQIKPLAVADYADNYKSVLTGPSEFQGVFTKKGLAAFEEMVAKTNASSSGERCVMGESAAGQTVQNLDSSTRDQLKSAYLQQYAKAWREFLGSYAVISYSGGPADAARRLNILSGARSPLLAIVRLVADNTNFPPAKPGESWWEKLAPKVGLGGILQAQSKAEQAKDQVRQVLGTETPLMTTADLGKLFQPVLFTTPPELDLLVNEHDMAYVNGLRGLQQRLDDLARASTTESAAAIPQARAAWTQAHQAFQTLADQFRDVGNEGLNKQLENLLEQPIRLADPVIGRNGGSGLISKKNGDLVQFCRDMSPILAKFPFNPSDSGPGATVKDLVAGFKPGTGRVATYLQQSAAELVLRRGQDWVPNPALQGQKVTQELLTFLNGAEKFEDAFFSDGGATPGLQYALRRVSGQSMIVLVAMDGTELNSQQDALRKTFHWPARSGEKQGASGTVQAGGGGLSAGFGRFDDQWGVFRLLQNADDRPMGQGQVQWSQIRGPGGAALQPLNPPAKVEIVEFPGNIDVFNPKFFTDLRCPRQAVVPN